MNKNKNNAINSYNEDGYYFINNDVCSLTDYAITSDGIYFIFKNVERELNIIEFYKGFPYTVTDKNGEWWEVFEDFDPDNLLFYVIPGSGYVTWKTYYSYVFEKRNQDKQPQQLDDTYHIVFFSRKDLYRLPGIGW